jgi:hypothetical protein
MTMAATTGVAMRDAGLASGLINTSRQIGAAVGLAALATVAISRADHTLGHHVVTRALTESALTSGYDRAFQFGAAIAVVMALIALVIIPKLGVRPASVEVEAESLEMIALEGV